VIDQLISLLTLTAMLLHAVLGCHAHHTHDCPVSPETAVATVATAVESSHSHHHGHQHALPQTEDVRDSHDHAPGEHEEHRNCEEGGCQYLATPATKLSPPDEQLSFDGEFKLPIASYQISVRLSVTTPHCDDHLSNLWSRCAPLQECTQAWLL